MFSFYILINFLIVYILAEDENTTSPELSKHIYYGELVRIEDFPFFAGLEDCGAVILSEIWILTAAHCVIDVCTREPKIVRVGATTKDDSIIVPYDEIIVHHGFNNMCGAPINDIALLKLTTPLEFSSKVQPVKLPNEKPTSKNLVLVAKGSDETGSYSKYLEKVDLIQLPMRDCVFTGMKNKYHSFVKENLDVFERSNICAIRPVDLPSVCFGDSGSPLVSDGILFGLTSYVLSDPREYSPCNNSRLGFFTNVTTYVPWISRHTGL